MATSNCTIVSLQLAQNEAMGAGDHRPSISSRRKPSGTIQRKINHQNLLFSFICLLSCVFLLILFFGECAKWYWLTHSNATSHSDKIAGFYADVHPIVDRIATTLGYQNKQYAVVIDAGSTGSRVLAYEFHKSLSSKYRRGEGVGRWELFLSYQKAVSDDDDSL